MKILKTLTCCLFLGAFFLPLMAKEEKSKSEVGAAIKERLHTQVLSLLALAEKNMKKGQYRLAERLIVKARKIEPHNEQAAELKEINDKELDRVQRQEIAERYQLLRDRTIKDSLKSLEKRPDHIQKEVDKFTAGKKPGHNPPPAKKTPHKKKAKPENDWVQPILDNLEKNFNFQEEGDGKALAKKLGKLLGVNVVVDAEVRLMETFKETLEIDYRHMNGKNLLHNLCRQWGVSWYLENQALVISKNKPVIRANNNTQNLVQNFQQNLPQNLLQHNLPAFGHDPFDGNMNNFGILGLKDSWGNDVFEARGLNLGGFGVYGTTRRFYPNYYGPSFGPNCYYNQPQSVFGLGSPGLLNQGGGFMYLFNGGFQVVGPR